MARDRDLNFEKALARNLRSSVAQPTVSRDACADTEFLAAYHERSLPAEQSALIKQHVAACSRCREILAHLEATDSIALETPEPVPANVLTTPATQTAR